MSILSHVGTDESSDPTAYDVIKAVDGIDVYVDGHSHTTFKNGEKVNDTLISKYRRIFIKPW